MILTVEDTNGLIGYLWDELDREQCRKFVIQYWMNDHSKVLGGSEVIPMSIPNPFDRLELHQKLFAIDKIREAKPEYWISTIMIIEDSIQKIDNKYFIAFCQQLGCKNEPTTIHNINGVPKILCKECGKT